MNRLDLQRLAELEARVTRIEQMNRRLAMLHNLVDEDVVAEESRGVRYGMPSTFLEFEAWCRLHGLESSE